MLSGNDYLDKRSRELGLERGLELERVQRALDALWAAQARAISLNDGVLKIVTPNASIASELRLRQVEFLEAWRKLLHSPLKRLHIQIRSLS